MFKKNGEGLFAPCNVLKDEVVFCHSLKCQSPHTAITSSCMQTMTYNDWIAKFTYVLIMSLKIKCTVV